jgi:hypothetical protein
MTARLAGLPLEWRLRQALVGAVILSPVALIELTQWLWVTKPAPVQPLVPLEATVQGITVSYASKYEPTAWIDVEMPDHRRATVRARRSDVIGCRPGSRIRLKGTQSQRGFQIEEVDPQACR